MRERTHRRLSSHRVFAKHQQVVAIKYASFNNDSLEKKDCTDVVMAPAT